MGSYYDYMEYDVDIIGMFYWDNLFSMEHFMGFFIGKPNNRRSKKKWDYPLVI